MIVNRHFFRIGRFIVLAVALAFVLGNISSLQAGEHSSVAAQKIEPGLLENIQETGEGEYWVRMNRQADLSPAYQISDWSARGWFVYNTLRDTAEQTQRSLINYLDREMLLGNVQSYRSFFINNSVLVSSNETVLNRIANRTDVSAVEAVKVYSVPDPIRLEDSIQALEWGVSRIGSPQIWSEFGTTGEGVVVANIDTGVDYNHPALVNQYRGNNGGSFNHNFNWYDATGLCPGSTPCDQNDHGTHTMGTMVGDDGGSNQIGNAPGATWIAARGCELNTCSNSALTASWEWIVAPCALGDDPGDPSCNPDERPHVLNYSIGGPGGDPSDQPLINAARAAGIVLSISAGNSGPGSSTIGSPGDYCNVIGVGATDINDVIASFSSRGPGDFAACTDKPDVSAPGANVRSSVDGGGYANFSGTSRAAPHVAGCAALLKGIDINVTHDEIYDLLTTTGVDLGSSGFDFNYGYGRINCHAAAQAMGPPGPTPTPTSPPPPTATPTPLPGNTIFFDNFESNQGWTTNPNGTDSATSGQWERANPETTSSGSDTMQLGTTVSGSFDLVTEGSAGSGVGANDIDNGVTTIRSPNINLPVSSNIALSFSYYLAHLNNATSADFLRVSVVGNTTQVVFEELGAGNTDVAVWASTTVSLNSFSGQTIYLLIQAADASSASLVEAAVDDVEITADTAGPTPTPPPPTPTPPPGGDVFFDNFETNQGWTTNPNGSDNATTGQWERANPETTSSGGSTMQLGTTVSGSFDLVTEGSAGSSVGSFDIDNGVTSIRSPNISLPSSGNLTLEFSYYLAHLNNASSADFLRVSVVGNTTQVVFEELGAGNTDAAVWASTSASLNSFAGQTVYILIEAADNGSGSLVEAGVDDVRITNN
jgi:subtilisin family serine protease